MRSVSICVDRYGLSVDYLGVILFVYRIFSITFNVHWFEKKICFRKSYSVDEHPAARQIDKRSRKRSEMALTIDKLIFFVNKNETFVCLNNNNFFSFPSGRLLLIVVTGFRIYVSKTITCSQCTRELIIVFVILKKKNVCSILSCQYY